jgi:serine kinase of HPr protein (carbohydrate metabolism regulator)
VHVWRSGDALYATAPRPITGRIEARGLGIVPVPDLYVSRVVKVVDCVQQATERMPDDDPVELCGLSIPRLTLDIRPQSAVETLIRAMAGLEP